MNDTDCVEVLLDVPLQGTFSYRLATPLPVGTRVRVNFGGRELCGVIANGMSGPSPGVKLKPVAEAYTALPPLPGSLLRMAAFAARYYHHPAGAALFTALPTLLRQPRDVAPPDRRPWRLTEAGRLAPPPPRQRARLALWQALAGSAQEDDALRAVSPQAARVLAEWAGQGLAERFDAPREVTSADGLPELTGEQAEAVEAVAASLGRYQAWLLQGVTGSGKTEVYLRLIARVLAEGCQALVVVPEISLTPQLIERFARRFAGARIACLHSHLADGERLEAWVDAWQGRADIVIGTRLSVFTPLPRLALIVVDEEHDASLKQHDGLRYHARDLAVWRAHDAGVPVLLGSATPSLESVANADAGRYRRLMLTRRAHAAARLPAVRLIDTRRAELTDGLSAEVVDALSGALARRELSLVYINRRGYAPVLACPQCGWTSGCPHCSARQVVHLQARVLRCHHCGDTEPLPRACPDCGNADIRPLGEGTQRLESALGALLPKARILRIDRDTTARKDAWDAVYRRVSAGEVDILVGTQMLAKGHDFGALSLVVALGCDGGLYSADFRAGERLFSTLMQVAGRAGRAGVAGEVLVQTQWPDHPLYQALARHDFDGYAETLLSERREAGFPPAAHQALVRADAPDGAAAAAFLQGLLALVADDPAVRVFGPAPALMARLAGRERAQLVIECTERARLHAWLSAAEPVLARLGREAGRALRWSIDVDPLEL